MTLLPAALTAEPGVLSPDWWSAFTRSAGFGGCAAVTAALLALLGGARRNATDRDLALRERRAQVDDDVADRWWATYRWCLDGLRSSAGPRASVLLHELLRQAPSQDARDLVLAAT